MELNHFKSLNWLIVWVISTIGSNGKQQNSAVEEATEAASETEEAIKSLEKCGKKVGFHILYWKPTTFSRASCGVMWLSCCDAKPLDILYFLTKRETHNFHNSLGCWMKWLFCRFQLFFFPYSHFDKRSPCSVYATSNRTLNVMWVSTILFKFRKIAEELWWFSWFCLRIFFSFPCEFSILHRHYYRLFASPWRIKLCWERLKKAKELSEFTVS